ncbi:MAG: hypothetical protein ABEJ87_06140 [Candidatus Nanohalobium sp.]
MKKTTILILLIILISFSASAENGNYTEISNQLGNARNAIQQMEKAGIPTERVESLLNTANTSFKAQKGLAQQGGDPDFSRVRELSTKVIDLKGTALRVNDRLIALQNRIEKLEKTNLNLTEVKAAYNKLNRTFNNQRFEKAEKMVKPVYTEISEARSVQTRVQAFASAQQENIISLYKKASSFAQKNWKKVSLGALLGVLILASAVREINLWRLEKRREKKLGKINVIEDMMEKAQKEYYVEGEGSEISFETRMDKFQEMKRELNQEVNELETHIESKRALPVISPEIKEKSEEFQAEGEVMEEAGEVKGSLERISERREQEEDKEDEEEVEKAADDTEEKSEQMKEYEETLNNDTVKEVKDQIEKLENPDYEALLRAEKRGKNRKTLKEYLKDNMQIEVEEVEEVEPTDKQRELLQQETVKEARDEIRELDSPDYKALLKAEKEGKDRKTLKEYLKEQIRLE